VADGSTRNDFPQRAYYRAGAKDGLQFHKDILSVVPSLGYVAPFVLKRMNNEDFTKNVNR
jgi:hypothetical protein